MSLAKDLWPSGKTSLDVCAKLKEPSVEQILGKEPLEQVVAAVKTVAEQPTMPSCHVFLGTV